MSIELTAPLTFILTKFQPEKCHMGPVPTIFHDFHGSGMHPGPSETGIWHSDLSGNTHKVPEPSSGTTIFRKLAFRLGKTACFSENCHFAYVKPLLLRASNLNGVHEGFDREGSQVPHLRTKNEGPKQSGSSVNAHERRCPQMSAFPGNGVSKCGSDPT